MVLVGVGVGREINKAEWWQTAAAVLVEVR